LAYETSVIFSSSMAFLMASKSVPWLVMYGIPRR
jgi:hypothetical protein